MSFSVSPVTGFPGPTPTEPKRNIQFQWNGVNIGERNTDTFNLVAASDGTPAGTIGVGEQVNIFTLAVDDSATPPLVPLWLDLFDGPADTPLPDHPQDLPVNSSTWLPGDSANWHIDGAGSALPEGTVYSFNYTQFNFGNYIQLDGLWTWEVEFSITDNPPDNFTVSLNGTASTILRIVEGVMTVECGGETSDPIPLPAAGAVALLRTVADPFIGFTVSIDGVDVVFPGSITWDNLLDGATVESQSDSGGGIATVHRMELDGALG